MGRSVVIIFSNITFNGTRLHANGRNLEEAVCGKPFCRDVILVERQELGSMFIIN